MPSWWHFLSLLEKMTSSCHISSQLCEKSTVKLHHKVPNHSKFAAGYGGPSNGQPTVQAASMKHQKSGSVQNRNQVPPVFEKVCSGASGGAAGQAKSVGKETSCIISSYFFLVGQMPMTLFCMLSFSFTLMK